MSSPRLKFLSFAFVLSLSLFSSNAHAMVSISSYAALDWGSISCSFEDSLGAMTPAC